MFFSKLVQVVSLLALGLPVARGVLIPSIDPFYRPPAGFESKAPGTILGIRSIIPSFLGLIPDLGVQAYQLLYRTTAINGSAIAGVTTVFKPLIAHTDRFVSFHTAYDGSATICNPSYSYQLGALQINLISSVEMLLLQAFLLEGYIVSSPDYEGPDAAFIAGRLEGMVALDSMRAVANFRKTLGLSTKTPKIVGYGYSGGSAATGWAASLHQAYASELQVKGWAQGGTVANITGTIIFQDKTLFAGFLPAGIAGLIKPSAYGAQLQPILQRIGTPYGKKIVQIASTVCGVEDLFVFAGGSILSTDFQTLGPDFLYESTIAGVLEQNKMGLYANETPTAPVYMFHASKDEIIPYSDASTLNSAWCNDGASVNFVTYGSGGHLTTEIVGFIDAFKFVQSAFAGTVAPGCMSSTVLSSKLDPLALGLNLEPVLIGLVNALLVLGDGDSNVKSNLSTLNQTVPS
ncbi:secretory lipase-domain-containing protein [Cadophora sp. MPI-SDFR-AT-0126]|nr:secretory lipase-domain-containing protein [Leotiomycetes sp. MPI-SDFR-AT-0126]